MVIHLQLEVADRIVVGNVYFLPLITWPEIADMDSEHVRTLTNKMADLFYINH